MKFRTIKRNIIDFYKTFSLYKYYWKKKKSTSEYTDDSIIVMFDGKLKHGGISDRLWGIVSIYRYCLDFKKEFKLYFENPFILQDYLVPNKVDWRIDAPQIIYDINHSVPKYISMISPDYKEMYEILNRKLAKNKRQQHIYTNTRVVSKKEFGTLFGELFKMSDKLYSEFDNQIKKIAGPYVSCTFRFQQLLGDFKEGNFSIIRSQEEREELIRRCKDVLKKLHDYTSLPILVTSDSVSFLNSIEKIDYIYIVEGSIVHPDYDRNENSSDVYMKSFLDLFMIANAEKVFLCNVAPLYRSGFPETASCIFNRPYFEIRNFDNLGIEKG